MDYGLWADSTAMDMRAYYEANRPLTFWEKLFGRREYVESCVADDLMLGLIGIVTERRDSDATRSAETEGLGSLRTGKHGPKASPIPSIPSTSGADNGS